MRKLQIRSFASEVHLAPPQCVMFDGAAYRIEASRIIAALTYARVQGGTSDHFPGYEPCRIPAVEHAPGRVSPYLNVGGIAGCASCGFTRTKHFVGSKDRTLPVLLELLLDAVVFRIGAGETVQHSDTGRQLILAGRSHQGDDFGVRIEDDVLVTEGAPEVLTAALEKTPEAVERMVQAA